MEEVVGVLIELVLAIIGACALIKQVLKETDEKRQSSEHRWD